jgi:hypothetical protein
MVTATRKGEQMADSALFIGWGPAVRGREQAASTVFGEAVALWTKLQEDGVVESWGAYFLEPHGGDLEGFFVLHGDRERLAAARVSEEMDAVIQRAAMVVDRMGVVGAATGARIESSMAQFLANAAELG